MRVIIALVVGLLAGSLGGIKVYQSLSAGKEVPHAVMWMMGYHMGELGDAIKRDQCSPAMVSAHIDTLARVAADIEPVFLPMGDDLDALFVDHADALQASIESMRSATGTGCEALAAARKTASEACKGCHRDFR